MSNMNTNLTIYQTEAFIKSFKIPTNCTIPINDKITIPAYCHKGILKIYMQLLDEKLLNYSRISGLMREYNVNKVLLSSCYSDNIKSSNPRCIIYQVSSIFRCCLPDSIERYMSDLGKSSRLHIRSYERKLFSTYSSVTCSTQNKQEVDRNVFMEIIKLNRERCLSKGFKSGIDDTYAENLFSLISSHGSVTFFKLEDRIIAGVVLTKVEDEAFLHVISHDNLFNNSHIGYVVLKKAIEVSISDNIKIFNFLWGNSHYKVQFGGVKKVLYDTSYYRYSSDYFIALLLSQFKNTRSKIYQFMVKRLKSFFHLIRRKYMEFSRLIILN